MHYKVQALNRSKITLKEVVDRDPRNLHLNKENTSAHSKRRCIKWISRVNLMSVLLLQSLRKLYRTVQFCF